MEVNMVEKMIRIDITINDQVYQAEAWLSDATHPAVVSVTVPKNITQDAKQQLVNKLVNQLGAQILQDNGPVYGDGKNASETPFKLMSFAIIGDKDEAKEIPFLNALGITDAMIQEVEAKAEAEAKARYE